MWIIKCPMNPGMEEIMSSGKCEMLADLAHVAGIDANVFHRARQGLTVPFSLPHSRYFFAPSLTMKSDLASRPSAAVHCLISHNASGANVTAI
jgi:hypothetical protein